MPDTQRDPLFVRVAERALGAVAGLSYRHPLPVLVAALAFVALAWLGASRLTIDPDFANLLPATFPSVRGLERLEKRFGGVGYVTIVGRDAAPDDLARFADDLAPRLEALETVRYAKPRRLVSYLESHAGYFLEMDELADVRQRISAREKAERRKRNPMYIDLGMDEDLPPLDFSDILERVRSRLAGKGFDVEGDRPIHAHYLDPGRRMVVVFAKPSEMSSDFPFTKRVKADVERAIAEMDLSSYGPDFRVQLTGRYVKKVVLQERVARDVGIASWLALALIVLYLVVHLRGVVSVVILLVPLAVGLMGMAGFAGVAYGSLNMITAFIGAILLGLGIDHGLHLVGRYRSLRAEGEAAAAAIERAFSHTGRAVLVAAVTTTVGFSGLAVSEFKAFREFGAIAAVGMLAVVAADALLLPALLGLAERMGWRPGAVRVPRPGAIPRALPRLALPILVITLLALPLLIASARALEFDEDFRTMEGRDAVHALDEDVDKVVGYSSSPIVILTDTSADEAAVTEALRARMKRLGPASRIDFVASLGDFVPKAQQEKQTELERIGRTLKRIKDSWIKDEAQRDWLDRARKAAQSQPFLRGELPHEIRRQFSGMEEDAGFVLVFPGVRTSDGKEVMALAQEVRGIHLPDGRVYDASGEAMILADILTMLLREAVPVLTSTVVLVFLAMLLLMGSPRDAFLALVPPMLTLTTLFGLMPLAGLDLNYFNVLLIPVIFGASVDGGVHLVAEKRRSGDAPGALAIAGPAIAGALLTTGFGFGSLLVASHEALRSFGEVAAIGVAANALSCLLVLPALLTILDRRRARGA